MKVLLAKIFLNFVQSLSFMGALSVDWPSSFAFMFRVADASTSLGLDVWQTECELTLNTYAKFIFYMLFPFFLIAVVCGITALVYMVKRRRKSKWRPF